MLVHAGEVAAADGVLSTCSAFGEAIDAARAEVDIPVLIPNEATFAEALRIGRRIGMLATFEPSAVSMEAEFAAMVQATGIEASLRTHCVDGDDGGHDALLAGAVDAVGTVDALLLAHFSTSRAAQAVSAVAGCPVLTSPGSDVARFRSLLT